jgi:lysophospholipase L1-like esterase
MDRNIFLCWCWLFFVLLGAGCDTGPRVAPFSQEAVVLAFGDSLTYGTGVAAGQSYPEVLSQLLGKPVVNVGVPGEVTSAGLTRLPAMLERYHPTLVVLCQGGNDFLRRLDQEETRSNLKAMVSMIRSHGADVILIGVPKLGFGLEVPKLYASIAEEAAVPLEKGILLKLLSDNSMKSDAIHLNATGYRLMAEAVYNVIQKAQGR